LQTWGTGGQRMADCISFPVYFRLGAGRADAVRRGLQGVDFWRL